MRRPRPARRILLLRGETVPGAPSVTASAENSRRGGATVGQRRWEEVCEVLRTVRPILPGAPHRMTRGPAARGDPVGSWWRGPSAPFPRSCPLDRAGPRTRYGPGEEIPGPHGVAGQ